MEDALIKVLEIYAETNSPVTQQFYQGLCLKAIERIKELETAKTIGIQACDLLKERIKELEKAVDEWRTKADSELAINARLHTETANLAKRITELEDGYRQIQVLNAERDKDIKWLCEQALKGK